MCSWGFSWEAWGGGAICSGLISWCPRHVCASVAPLIASPAAPHTILTLNVPIYIKSCSNRELDLGSINFTI